MKMHESITIERISEAVNQSMLDLGYPGFCTLCGTEVEGIEPDATEIDCPRCGGKTLYGAEELMLEFFGLGEDEG